MYCLCFPHESASLPIFCPVLAKIKASSYEHPCSLAYIYCLILILPGIYKTTIYKTPFHTQAAGTPSYLGFFSLDTRTCFQYCKTHNLSLYRNDETPLHLMYKTLPQLQWGYMSSYNHIINDFPH